MPGNDRSRCGIDLLLLSPQCDSEATEQTSSAAPGGDLDAVPTAAASGFDAATD